MKCLNVMLLVLALAGAASASVPQITDFSVSQDDSSRKVTIDYRITGEPAVVTVDVLTNGTSIGYANLRGFVGDVYFVRPVSPTDSTYRITWRPDKYWPEGGEIKDGSVSFKLTAWSTNAPPEWLVADIYRTHFVYFYPTPELFPAGPELTNNVYKTDYLVMRKIAAAGKTFVMGQLGSASGAKAQRTVSFSKDFYISIFNLTAGQYHRIVNKNIEEMASDSTRRKPGVNLTWANMNVCADSTCALFAESFAPKFSLVTSAQWEFACRAGTTASRPFPPDEPLGDYAWYNANANGVVQEVGLKKPNPWLLYDMIGNVNEFTSDTYVNLTRSSEPAIDPSFSGDGNKVYHGGACNEEDSNLTSYQAGGFGSSNFNVGFRLGWTLP